MRLARAAAAAVAAVAVALAVTALVCLLRRLRARWTEGFAAAEPAEPAEPTEAELELAMNNGLVQLLSAADTKALLLSDPGGYVAGMTRADLAARGAQSTAEYLARSGKLAHEFTEAERRATVRAILSVQAWLTSAPRAGRTLLGVNFAKLAKLPWRVAATAPAGGGAAGGGAAGAYEANLPHTRSDVVLIAPALIPSGDDTVSQKRFAATLLHEKIHVYQRAYPQDIAAALDAEGYVRKSPRASVALARANPDLDDWVYLDPEAGPTKGKPMVALYASENPSGITDVTQANAAAFEHPYERMAYRIAAMY
jgi:hypothetical protein